MMSKFAILILIILTLSADLLANNLESTREQIKALTALSLADLMEVEVVELVSGFKQKINIAPASVTVITAQDINSMAARNLREVLETVPGIHISQADYNFNDKYNIRGINSTYNHELLLMLDGLPIKSIVNSSRGIWQPPPMHSIQKIEIIRGPGSALYGADAMSGVINIITKTGADVQGSEIGLGVGSFNTYNPWFLYGGEIHGIKTMLSVDYTSTDGHQEIIHQDVQSLLDQATGTNVSHAPGRSYLAAEHLQLSANFIKNNWRANLRHLESRNLGAGLGAALLINPEENFDVKDSQLDLFYQNSTDNFGLNMQLSYRNFKEWLNEVYSTRPNAIRDGKILAYGAPNNVAAYQNQIRADLGMDYYGLVDHKLKFGLGYAHFDLYSTPWSFMLDKTVPVMVDVRKLGMALLPENKRDNYYLFIQDTWNFHPDWELTLGLRSDWPSDFAKSIVPRTALVWQIRPELTSKLLYARAFRAPSFIEMYATENQTTLGNPNLKAEKSRTWELGFDYRPYKQLSFNLDLFDFKIKDRIVSNIVASDLAATGIILMYDNVDELHGRGLEFAVDWKLPNKANLIANYAYVELKTQAGEAGNYPRQQLYLRYNLPLNKHWDTYTYVNWVMDQQRPIGYTGAVLPDYVDLNLGLNYRVDTWQISAGIRNLLDKQRRTPGDARLIGDYPRAGREWFGEIRYKF
jgi:outer membrane receptor for ferrienterochelin and colicin